MIPLASESLPRWEQVSHRVNAAAHRFNPPLLRQENYTGPVRTVITRPATARKGVKPKKVMFGGSVPLESVYR